MAVDFHLKINGIEGESSNENHKNEIQLESWSWGESQTGSSAHGTGAGAGQISMQDFHFVMKMNKASPKLLLACAQGKHIPDATLVCRKAGGKQEKYLEVKFSDVLISSYQTGGSGGGEVPMEQISFNFTKIEFDYLTQDAKGMTKSAGKVYYDLKKSVGG